MALDDYFDRENPGAGVALKRATDDVPADGRYHLLHNGAHVGSFRALKSALAAYQALIAETGWHPDPTVREKVDIGKLATDKFFDDYDNYWSRASAFTPKGGKGRG